MRIINYLLIFLISLSVQANEATLIDQFFGASGISDKKAVYTGEMLKYHLNNPTLGESLPKGIQITYRMLKKNKQQSTYAISLSKNNKSQDWYIYFNNDNGVWKIAAIRNLALPRVFFMGLQELSNKSQRTKEEEYQYQNMLLTIKSDSELKEYFRTNIIIFSKIAEIAKSDLNTANKLAKSLYLNFVNNNKALGFIDINIGGIMDNGVGYMFIPSSSNKPKLSPDNYIYIEKITEEWFIYKTT